MARLVQSGVIKTVASKVCHGLIRMGLFSSPGVYAWVENRGFSLAQAFTPGLRTVTDLEPGLPGFGLTFRQFRAGQVNAHTLKRRDKPGEPGYGGDCTPSQA